MQIKTFLALRGAARDRLEGRWCYSIGTTTTVPILQPTKFRAEAEQVITNEPFDLQFQVTNGEERFVQLGETNAGRILVVVTTWRKSLIRVITAYDAQKAMKRIYVAQKGNSYGTDP
jgi:uncharacterized DUF497 family protein